jgi:protocatechuate 3,4-dioxygenase beta subunit
VRAYTAALLVTDFATLISLARALGLTNRETIHPEAGMLGIGLTRRALFSIPVAALLLLASVTAQTPSVHEAPPNAPSTGRVTPPGEPGQPLTVSGVVVGPDNKPITGASLYIYQTDREGYYGVKPASDNRNPRLELFLRTDASGAYSFDTIKPGSYPNSRIPAHIHFEVSAPGRASNIFEIVFTGDPFITADMRSNPAFSERPIEDGKVVQRIVLK